MKTEKKQNENIQNTENIDTSDNNSDSTSLQNKKISDLTNKLLINQKKINDIELRQLAQIDNIKKNTQEKINKIKNIETETFLKKTIPIIDSLEDTLSLSKKLNIKDQPLITGIELTLNTLFNILLKLGVKVEGEKNEIFNSDIHNIITTKPSEKISDNHIISVHKKGLVFNKLLLRKAEVTVSKK